MNEWPAVRRVSYWLLPLFTGGLALLLYATTAAPWLTWAHDGADGGDLIAATMTLGVPHPPGYPTYCLLARLFAVLPLGNIARRFNLFSATAAAGAVAVVCLVVQRTFSDSSDEGDGAVRKGSWIESFIAASIALSCATGHTLWSQATITEVYALSVLFFASCLYLALRTSCSDKPLHWGMLGLLFGLGLGAHLTLVLMLPGLALLLWPHRNRARMVTLLFGTIVGIGVFAYLPLAARGAPPINWGDADSWGRFWWMVSGRMYQSYAFSLPLTSLPSRLAAWASLWRQNYGIVGLALALYGLSTWLAAAPRQAWATLITVAAYSLYAIGYDTTDSYVYLLPTYLITALWMLEGARVAWTALSDLPHSNAWRVLATIILLAMPVHSLYTHYDALDLSRDRVAIEWAQTVVERLPPDAVLITGEDRHTFTMSYVQWVEHRRPDLWVVDGELWAHDWYREQPRPFLCAMAGEIPIDLFSLVDAALLCGRPVYLGSERKDLTRRYESSLDGVLWRIRAQ